MGGEPGDHRKAKPVQVIGELVQIGTINAGIDQDQPTLPAHHDGIAPDPLALTDPDAVGHLIQHWCTLQSRCCRLTPSAASRKLSRAKPGAADGGLVDRLLLIVHPSLDRGSGEAALSSSGARSAKRRVERLPSSDKPVSGTVRTPSRGSNGAAAGAFLAGFVVSSASVNPARAGHQPMSRETATRAAMAGSRLYGGPMASVKQIQVTFDCAEPERVARFWCEVLGYVVPPPPEGFATWDDFDRALPPEHQGSSVRMH